MPVPKLDLVSELATVQASLTSLHCSPDGAWVVCGSLSTEIFFVKTDGSLKVESIPNRGIVVSWSPDGKYIASAIDERLVISDATSGKMLHRYECHREAVLGLAFSSRGDRFASCGKNELFLHATGDPTTRTMQTPGSAINRRVKFLWDDALLMMVNSAGKISFWDNDSGAMVEERDAHEGEIRCLAVSPDGRKAATCGLDKKVKVWAVGDLSLREPLSVYTLPMAFESVDFCSCGSRILCGGYESVTQIDLTTGDRSIRNIEGTRSSFLVQKLPDGQHFVTAGSDCVIRLWKL